MKNLYRSIIKNYILDFRYGSDYITFKLIDNSLIVLNAYGDCSSVSKFFNIDIIKLNKLKGCTIISIDELEISDNFSKELDSEISDDSVSELYYYYEIKYKKSNSDDHEKIMISMKHMSNGYYNGWLEIDIFEKINPITFIIGLPASGKTNYMNTLFRNKSRVIRLDDCVSNYNKQNIINYIQSNYIVILNDPRFINTEIFLKWYEMIQCNGWIDENDISLIIFNNDPKQCIINNEIRNKKISKNVTNEEIENRSKYYDIEYFKKFKNVEYLNVYKQ